MSSAGPDVPVAIRRGSLYLDADVCRRYFAGLETVALLRRDADLFILPVHNAVAGGFLLKQRNPAGDRVVVAPEFFRDNGVPDEPRLDLSAVWSNADAALRVPSLFSAN